MGRLRAELAGDKEAALSALRRESDEELKVVATTHCMVARNTLTHALSLISCIHRFELENRWICTEDEYSSEKGSALIVPCKNSCLLTVPNSLRDVQHFFTDQATRKSLTDKMERALADATQSRAICAEEKKRIASMKSDRERYSSRAPPTIWGGSLFV